MHATQEKASKTRYGRVKLPDDKVLEVFRLRLAGQSFRAIAEALGIHFVYAAAVVQGEARKTAHPDHPLRRACVDAERAKREAFRRRSGERRQAGKGYDAAIRDYRRGYSLRAAAARNGLTLHPLYRECVRRGVKRRPPSKRSKFCHDSKGSANG